MFIVQAANNYIYLGFSVFPLKENTKDDQVVSSWINDATRDKEQVALWWQKNPNYNLGVKTGNGYIVIDVDNINGKNGNKVIEKFLDEFPETRIVRTPNDGMHIYYKVNKEVRCKVNLYEGIDVRGDGGYVVGVGSVINGKEYKMDSGARIAEANEAVYHFLEGGYKLEKEYKYEDTQSSDYIYEGERNDRIFKEATALKAKGLNYLSIVAAMKEENQLKCIPPLDEKEVLTICSSVEKRFAGRDKSLNRHPDDEISTVLKSVDEIKQQEMEWVVEGLIPKNQITILAGDGGIGKTSVWAHIAARLSTGQPLFFEKETGRKPMNIVYFSGEDPTDVVLKKKILESEGDMKRIRTIELDDERLSHVRFGSRFLENIIQDNRPDVIIFDPLQSFLPAHTNMSARNQMRDALGNLLYLGRKYQVSFLVTCHTNKKPNAGPRERAADSADIWDIARSFIFVGVLKDDLRYLSNEKNNYAELQKTYLFSVEKNKIEFKGISDKRDFDFQNEKLRNQRNESSLSLAKEDIISLLKNGEQRSKDIENVLRGVGYTPSVIDRARRELRKEKLIDFRKDGSNRDGDKQETIYYLTESS